MRRWRSGAALLALSLAGAALWGVPAAAVFSRSATSGGLVGTGTLAPPTSLAATGNGIALSCAVTITWTASSSPFRSGYTIQRYRAGVESGPRRSADGLATMFVDALDVHVLTSYTWEVRATAGAAWVSPVASVAKSTSALCT